MALIQSDVTSEGWMGWEQWFTAVGFRPQYLHYAFRCSLYTDAVQAALAGQGVILGWGRLVNDLLAAGELVRLTTATLNVADAYYVVVPQGRTVSPAVEQLIACLREDLPRAEFQIPCREYRFYESGLAYLHRPFWFIGLECNRPT
ncbi:LysR substrate-binding domain-containing protein [Vogesella sp. GCM10023246]|uniref:LysR substrate-binding domain-containing protein n=1 Tax=Vogesella oryzagri TaxID=3160864 RepID=A0ABV1M2R6_9NEIS